MRVLIEVINYEYVTVDIVMSVMIKCMKTVTILPMGKATDPHV
jgi:hypothetical protein